MSFEDSRSESELSSQEFMRRTLDNMTSDEDGADSDSDKVNDTADESGSLVVDDEPYDASKDPGVSATTRYTPTIQLTKELQDPSRFSRQEPCGPGIYFLFQNDKIVYVGLSEQSVLNRVGNHVRDNRKQFDNYAVLPASTGVTKRELYEIERTYIRQLNPKYNGGCPPQSPSS